MPPHDRRQRRAGASRSIIPIICRIPIEEQWDLVVGNPPFFDNAAFHLRAHGTETAHSTASTALAKSATVLCRRGDLLPRYPAGRVMARPPTALPPKGN